MYEKRLQELNPQVQNIQYDVKNLHAYVDHLTDLCALVYATFSSHQYFNISYTHHGNDVTAGSFDPQTRAYVPHDKQWIKDRILNQLKRAAGLR